MCGLAGVIGLSSYGEAKAFIDLLQVTSLRGPHSTGLAIATGGTTSIQKGSMDAVAFVQAPSTAKVLDPWVMLDDVYMGHCRYATVGSVTSRNAHPFRAGKLIVAHNGTIQSCPKLKGDKTDSEWLAQEMSSKGIIPALSSLELDDSFAVSVYDSAEKCVYLARNQERPLFLAVAADTGTVFYGSERLMLEFALARNGVGATYTKVTPWRLYKIVVDDLTKSCRTPWTEEEINAKDIPF